MVIHSSPPVAVVKLPTKTIVFILRCKVGNCPNTTFVSATSCGFNIHLKVIDPNPLTLGMRNKHSRNAAVVQS